MKILLPSVQSLFIQMLINGHKLSTGTGFVVNSPRGPVLVTNRHNVTGRDNNTGETLSPNGLTPDSITIMHNLSGHLGAWEPRSEPLYFDYNPLWIEHPTLGKAADFVALPLTAVKGIQLYPYELIQGEPLNIKIGPSDSVSVVGFPFGLAGGGAFGIWATGFLATELDVNYQNLPIFLIDCRARPGQSGSAVIIQRNSGMVLLNNGSTSIFEGPMTDLIGIYSGRINKESDLGIVWKSSAIKELVDSII